MSPPDWNADARANANRAQRDASHIPRGVIPVPEVNVCVVFGNDDYAHDDRARLEVTIFRQHLHDADIVELGFGQSDDGRSWAMIVHATDEPTLTAVLFDSWQIAFDVAGEAP